MKDKNITLWIIATYLLAMNLWRAYIIYWGFEKLGRMPINKDMLEILKPIIFSWQADENILLLAHFLTPVLIFSLIIFFIRKLFQKQFYHNRKPFIFLIVVFLFEVMIRYSDAYEYVMID